MSLKYALLGVISIRSMTGYDMKKFFDRVVGMIWNADHGQIYRLLRRLEGDGLVVQQVVPQTKKPDKRVWSLTPKGKEDLCLWLENPITIGDLKDEFVLWFFFSDLVDKTKVREQLVQARASYEERLQTLQMFQEGRLTAASKTILHASRLGSSYYEDRIRWIDDTIGLIDCGEI